MYSMTPNFLIGIYYVLNDPQFFFAYEYKKYAEILKFTLISNPWK